MESIKNIVVVDDDPIYSFIIKQYIRRIDPTCKIFCFSVADEGYSFLKENGHTGVKLVLLDLNMPDVHGWEMVRKVCHLCRENEANIVLYVVTNSVAVSDVEKVKEFSCVQRLLLKPLESEILKKLLNSVP